MLAFVNRSNSWEVAVAASKNTFRVVALDLGLVFGRSGHARVVLAVRVCVQFAATFAVALLPQRLGVATINRCLRCSARRR